MRSTTAVALVGAFTFAAAQSESAGPLPSNTLQGAGQATSPIPSSDLASDPNDVPSPLASNSVVEPQDVSPGAPSGVPSGVTVHIIHIGSANGGGATPVVIGPNGPEPVQLAIGPNGAPVIQSEDGLVPVAEIIGPDGQVFEPSPATNSAPVASSAPVPGTSVPVSVGSGTPPSVPAVGPIPVTPEELDNPNVIPEPVPSGVTEDLSDTMTPGEEVPGQEGYYHSSAGTVKVTATFALAAGIIVALWM